MRGLKNFGITFGVSIVILGILALFISGFVADTVCGIFEGKSKDLDNLLIQETTSSENNGSEKVVNGESFTWLMILSDYRPGVYGNYYPSNSSAVDYLKDFSILDDEYSFPEASNIILVHGNVEKRTFIITTIPAMTKISTDAGDFTLGQIYALDGATSVVNYVNAMTGLEIDYYSVLHTTDLSTLAGVCGSISCTIPKTIYSDGTNYLSIPETTAPVTDKDETTKEEETTKKNSKETKITTAAETTKALVNELDATDSVQLANKLMAALLYYVPEDGISDEMTIEQSFANGLLSNLSNCSDSELQSMLNSLKSYFVSTNLSTDAIYLCGDVIRAYTIFDIKTLTYPGKFVSSKGSNSAYYKPDVGTAVGFFYDYR